MKVTIENKKGLSKDLKVIIDKKTMDSYLNDKYEEIKKISLLKVLDQVKHQEKLLKDNLVMPSWGKFLIKF